jgi:predicted transcriptional regulator
MSNLHDETRGATLLASVTEIVSVYLQQNRAQPDQLAQIISSVTDALRGAVSQAPTGSTTFPPLAAAGTHAAEERVTDTAAPQPVSTEPARPAVPIDESVHSDYLICLECGIRQKLLKKHLRIAHGLSPQEYRKRFSLDATYPLAAPSFAEGKREMAKRIGLGRGRTAGQTGSAAEAEPAPAVAPAAATARSDTEGTRRGRGRRASATKAGQGQDGIQATPARRGRKPRVTAASAGTA